jgi:hypothetical protein
MLRRWQLGSFDDYNGRSTRTAEFQDISGELTITDQRPRFIGTYSDIYIGRIRNETVRPRNSQTDEREADLVFR